MFIASYLRLIPKATNRTSGLRQRLRAPSLRRCTNGKIEQRGEHAHIRSQHQRGNAQVHKEAGTKSAREHLLDVRGQELE
ncbi:MAG: hypothetical protein A2W25_10500 [candidate division Zixibacteria bacterium RBG_16_53_22]|nr:MAG: hypothetical protein A2W25_10500 [candidate division Zixibacteria bacterium RBG_16_53_22]